jgi:hypothetical protein
MIICIDFGPIAEAGDDFRQEDLLGIPVDKSLMISRQFKFINISKT